MSTEDLIRDALEETGLELRVDAQELRVYMAQRAAHLTTLVGQRGFDRALRAERDSVALWAGIRASARARAAEQRFIGIVQALLLGMAS